MARRRSFLNKFGYPAKQSKTHRSRVGRIERLEDRRLMSANSIQGSHELEKEILSQQVIAAAPLPSVSAISLTNAVGKSGIDQAPSDLSAAAPQAASFALTDTFRLHSLPGATKVIYLDFDGHTTAGTAWNIEFRNNAIVTPTFSFEGDASFSTAELERIQQIWERVSEDFRPFNIDVTTEDPGVEALKNTGSGDLRWGQRVVVGGNSNDWYTPVKGAVVDGIGYFNSFADTFGSSYDVPVFVFSARVGDAKGVAEMISHEAGHGLGVDHDALLPLPPIGPIENNYYTGHGTGETSWAPIMGFASRELSQWSKGEYPNAHNQQDDLAIITSLKNGVSYRADDYGNTSLTASSLTFVSNGMMGSGIIERNTDVDFFSLYTTGERLNLSVTPFHRGANLDILAKLYSSNGSLIAVSNPVDLLGASITANLAAGVYYISIEGTGKPASGTDFGYSKYGSLGSYNIAAMLDSPPVSFVANDPDSGERNDSGTVYVRRNSSFVGTPLTVNYTIGGAATNGADYSALTGSVTVPAGQYEAPIVISPINDSLAERAESVVLTLANSNDYSIGSQSSATILIGDDDAASAADGYLSQTATNPQPGSSVKYQYVSSGSWQTIASKDVTIGPTNTGFVDLDFQVQVFPNSANDIIELRYLIDGVTDPNDVAMTQTFSDLAQTTSRGAYGTWNSLSLTHQLRLTAGQRTVSVQIRTYSPTSNGHDVVVWYPVLKLTAFRTINGQSAADVYQNQLPANPDSPATFPGRQLITPGSWQTLSQQEVVVGPNSTGKFDLDFQLRLIAAAADDQVKIRYLIDGAVDPNDASLTITDADLIENLSYNGLSTSHSISLMRQLTLGAGTHTVAIQILSAAGLAAWNPVLQLTGYNKIGGQNAVDVYQNQSLASPNQPTGAQYQYVSAGTYQTVSRQQVTVGANSSGLFDLGFQVQLRSNSADDAVKVRYLIDGQLDPTNVATSQIPPEFGFQNAIKPLKANAYGNWHSVNLRHQLNLSPGTHTIEIQVLSQAVAPNSNGHDLVVWNPVLRLTGYNTSLGPEIDVQGKGISIVDGDTTPSTTDATDFGSQNVSNGSVSKTFTIVNRGSSTLNLNGSTRVQVSSVAGTSGWNDFTVSALPSATVAPGASTTFTVVFNPNSSGLRTAKISIVNNDIDEGPYDFIVQGTGVSTSSREIDLRGNDVVISTGDATPNAADFTNFGTQSVANGAVTRTFEIVNLGGSSLSLTGSQRVEIRNVNGGVGATDFRVVTQPGSSIAAGGRGTFQIVFDPSAAGLRMARVRIANNDSNEGTYEFVIHGIGETVPLPEINLSAGGVTIADGDMTPSAGDSTDFGSLNVTGAPVTRTFTISNLGNAALNLTGTPRVQVSGANVGDFTVVQPIASSIAAGGSLTFQITFDAIAAGLRTAIVSILNSDGDESLYDFAIQGTGVVPAPEIELRASNGVVIADGDLTPGTADLTDFGSQNVASGSVTRTFTIANTGTQTLNLTGSQLVQVTGANASDFQVVQPTASTIAAGGSLTFQVIFDPSASGLRTATLSIANNDANENAYDFAIQGTGTTTPVEPGHTLATALSTGLGPMGGTLVFPSNKIGDGSQGTKDVDLFSLQAVAGSTVTIQTSRPSGGTTVDTYLRLFDASGTQLPNGYQDDYGGSVYSRISNFAITATGTYYVGVSEYDNRFYNPVTGSNLVSAETGDYALTISLTPSAQAASASAKSATIALIGDSRAAAGRQVTATARQPASTVANKQRDTALLAWLADGSSKPAADRGVKFAKVGKHNPVEPGYTSIDQAFELLGLTV